MAEGKSIRCDCGYRVRGTTEERQVAEVRRHAWDAHGISFSTEEALAVLLRLELEPDETDRTALSMDHDTERGKEQP
jgi:predicted small metal-binding protein